MPYGKCDVCGEYDFSERHSCNPLWKAATFVEAQEWPVEDWTEVRGARPQEAAEAYLFGRWRRAPGDFDAERAHDIVLQPKDGGEFCFVRLRGEYRPEFWSEEMPTEQITDFEPAKYAT